MLRKETWNSEHTTLLQLSVLVSKERRKKNPTYLYKNNHHFITFHTIHLQRVSNFHKIFFTHRQLGNVGDVRARGAGENWE